MRIENKKLHWANCHRSLYFIRVMVRMVRLEYNKILISPKGRIPRAMPVDEC